MRAKDGKVYIGDLLESVKREELEKQLARFGRVTECWVAHNPPGFAFAEFANVSDAESAVKSLDGKNVCGSRVRVEMAHSDGPKFEANPRRPLLGARGTLRVPIHRPLGRTLLKAPLLPHDNALRQRQRHPLLGAQGRLRIVKRLSLSARRTLLSTPSTLHRRVMSTRIARLMSPRSRQLPLQSLRRMSPEPYRRMSPEVYHHMPQDFYRQMSPEPHHQVSMEPYRRMPQEPYRRMSPEPFRRFSPELFRSRSPLSRQQASLESSRHTSHLSLHSRRGILPLPDTSRRSLLPPPDGTGHGILPLLDDIREAILPLPDGDHRGIVTPPHRHSHHTTLPDNAYRVASSPPRRPRRTILPLPNAARHPMSSPPRHPRRGILPMPDGTQRGMLLPPGHRMSSSPPRRPHRGILPLPDGTQHGILPLPDYRVTSSPPRHPHRGILPMPHGARQATISPHRYTHRPILPMPDIIYHATSPPRRQHHTILPPPNGSRRRTILPSPRAEGRNQRLEVATASDHYEGASHGPQYYPEERQRFDIPDAEYRDKAPLLATPTPPYRSQSALVPRHRSAPSVSMRTHRNAESLPRERGSESRRRHVSSHMAVTSSTGGKSSRSAEKHKSRKP